MRCRRPPAHARRRRRATCSSSATTGTARPTSSTRTRSSGLTRLNIVPDLAERARGDPRRPASRRASSSPTTCSSARATTSTSTTRSPRTTGARSTSRGRASPTSSRIDLGTRADRLAREGRRLPLRPHGDLARRPAAARLRLDGAQGPRHRHARRARSSASSPPATSRTRTTTRADGTPHLPREHRHASTRRSTRPRSTRRRASASSRSSTRSTLRDPASASTSARRSPTTASPATAPPCGRWRSSPDERIAYLQLSFLHGFVEFDLAVRQAAADRAAAALSAQAQDAAARGLPAGLRAPRHRDRTAAATKLCVAGTMSDYAAIVARDDFSHTLLDVGRKPVLGDEQRRRRATASSRPAATTGRGHLLRRRARRRDDPRRRPPAAHARGRHARASTCRRSADRVAPRITRARGCARRRAARCAFGGRAAADRRAARARAAAGATVRVVRRAAAPARCRVRLGRLRAGRPPPPRDHRHRRRRQPLRARGSCASAIRRLTGSKAHAGETCESARRDPRGQRTADRLARPRGLPRRTVTARCWPSARRSASAAPSTPSAAGRCSPSRTASSRPVRRPATSSSSRSAGIRARCAAPLCVPRHAGALAAVALAARCSPPSGPPSRRRARP